MMLARLGRTAYTAAHIPGQARFPFRSEAAIRRARLRRVRTIVAYAERTVPYYGETLRRLGLTAADFRDAVDLARLPVLEREHLQRDPEYFLSTAVGAEDRRRVASSGSTGAPLALWWDTAAHFRSVAYARRIPRPRPRPGPRPSLRETVIAAPGGSVRAGREFSRRAAVTPGTRRQELSLFASPEVNAAAIAAVRPHVIATYGSYLDELVAHVVRRGRPLARPRAVAYGADAMSAETRRILVEEWGVAVYAVYQSVEVANIAFDCGQGAGLHLNLDLCPVRVVDAAERPCAPGEQGELIVSNLVNRATVLLNYRIGDLATLAPAACPCGRKLPLLAGLDGRADDWLESSDGRRRHPQVVTQAFRGAAGVSHFQVVQPHPGRLEIAVVATPGADPDELVGRLRSEVEHRLGSGTEVSVTATATIPRAATGKRRAVVTSRGGACAPEGGPPATPCPPAPPPDSPS